MASVKTIVTVETANVKNVGGTARPTSREL